MFVKQNQDTFIRVYANQGYITNQYTQQDRVYDDIGADFLSLINRRPRTIVSMVDELYLYYGESASKEEIYAELYAFISVLAEDKFLLISETLEGIAASEDAYLKERIYQSYKYEGTSKFEGISAENFSSDVMMESAMNHHFLQGIQFELTGRCNERCIHCYLNNKKKDSGIDMPYEKVVDIIDQFAAMGGFRITLSGGEIFMHTRLMDIIDYCRSKDMMITLLSNVIGLTEYHIKKIVENNIAGIQVSLYSMNPETHDTITTVKGSFVRTKSAILRLREAGVPVIISCPLMKMNYMDFADVMIFGQSIGCKTTTDFTLMAQSDLDTSNLRNRLSLEEVETAMRMEIEHSNAYTTNVERLKPASVIRDNDIEEFKKRPLCGAANNSCCVSEDGMVHACPGWQGYPLGNLYDSTLEDIWNNSPRANFLRTITEGSFEKCLTCDARDWCHRCLVKNFNESNGDMFKINPYFCQIAFLTKSLIEEYRSKGIIKGNIYLRGY